MLVKGAEDSVQKAWKSTFLLPHCCLTHRLLGTLNIRVYLTYCQELQSLRYIFVDDSVGHSDFHGGLSQRRMCYETVQNGLQDHPRSLI